MATATIKTFPPVPAEPVKTVVLELSIREAMVLRNALAGRLSANDGTIYQICVTLLGLPI